MSAPATAREGGMVGRRVPRVDAREKVLGATVYGHDFTLPRMAWGKILRSPLPHARIVRIDTSRAEALDGVVAVATAADTPCNTYGFQAIIDRRLADKMPMERDKVRFIGDEVAAVAAETEAIAERALELIHVEYEELEPVFDFHEADKPGAPLIHEGTERNVIDSFDYGTGDLEQGFAEADVIHEGTYFSQAVISAPMETHQCIADWGDGRRLTVWSSTQMPFLLRNHLAEVLGLTDGDVRVIKQPMGGGFGSRMEMHSIDPICAVLARKARRPVKIVYTRVEEFWATRFRHPIEMRVKVGAKRDGTLTAMEMELLVDSGAYVAQACGVARVGAVNAATLYRVPNTRVHSRTVYTNNPYASAFRGYGNTQGDFAFESAIEDLLEQLDVDPIEFRVKNGNRTGLPTYLGQLIHSCGYEECLVEGAKAARWSELHGKRLRDGSRVRGIGVASVINVGGGARDQGDSDASGAVLQMRDDGSVSINAGGQEIGSGGSTIFSQIAAEELGVTLDRVVVLNWDTDVMPWDIGCHAQRNVFCAGNAVRAAAVEAREQLLAAAARQLGVEPEQIRLGDNAVWVGDASEPARTIGEVVWAEHFRPGGGFIWGKGFYDPPTVRTDEYGRGHKSGAYSFGAQFAEVEVDLETGRVEIVKIVAAHDVGRAINPAGVEAQIEGGVMQGVGQALYEEMVFEDGRLLTPTFSTYRMPTAADAFPIESIIVESDDPEGPYGAKGVAEATCVPTLAAIRNAILDATGVRIDALPLTPERVLAALDEAGVSLR
ncbi:MAG TPA: molybdopterin cofactor-binding domain-containing protein [Conexibacter sp.]|nr:molybdopterin cofactor-binding domain-containing protein [Conexibacter sp.]